MVQGSNGESNVQEEREQNKNYHILLTMLFSTLFHLLDSSFLPLWGFRVEGLRSKVSSAARVPPERDMLKS